MHDFSNATDCRTSLSRVALATQSGLYFDGALWILDQETIDKFDLDVPETVPFAADAFGDLFCITGSQIGRLNLETLEVDEEWDSLDAWASAVASSPDETVGAAFLKDWQEKHGPIQAGQRLHPKMPFVLGGAYEGDNLYAASIYTIIEERLNVARQIRDLPDGARIMIATD